MNGKSCRRCGNHAALVDGVDGGEHWRAWWCYSCGEYEYIPTEREERMRADIKDTMLFEDSLYPKIGRHPLYPHYCNIAGHDHITKEDEEIFSEYANYG